VCERARPRSPLSLLLDGLAQDAEAFLQRLFALLRLTLAEEAVDHHPVGEDAVGRPQVLDLEEAQPYRHEALGAPDQLLARLPFRHLHLEGAPFLAGIGLDHLQGLAKADLARGAGVDGVPVLPLVQLGDQSPDPVGGRLDAQAVFDLCTIDAHGQLLNRPSS
jgi:hypothetical protein